MPSGALAAIVDHLRAGGVAIVPCPGAGRVIRLDARALARFERAGAWLLRESGDGYRLRQGRGSVYLHTSHLLTVGVDLQAAPTWCECGGDYAEHAGPCRVYPCGHGRSEGGRYAGPDVEPCAACEQSADAEERRRGEVQP